MRYHYIVKSSGIPTQSHQIISADLISKLTHKTGTLKLVQTAIDKQQTCHLILIFWKWAEY